MLVLLASRELYKACVRALYRVHVITIQRYHQPSVSKALDIKNQDLAMSAPTTDNDNTASFKPFKLLSFDVYGTLIDWESGLYAAAQPLLTHYSPTTNTLSREEFINLYNTLEGAQQNETPEMKYSEVLSTVYQQIASTLSQPPPPQEEADEFAASIKNWKAFPDTVDALKRLKKHFKLVVLSNVDRDSFATSLPELGGEGIFDAILTAQDIGSYKPDLNNFEYLLKEVKERFGVEKDEILHTAQSLHHDHIPAEIMKMRSAWISRKDATIGSEDDEFVKVGAWEWRFNTLGEMADAVEKELGGV